METGSYTNKDGNKVYTTQVIIENMEFAEKNKEENGKTKQQTEDEFMNVSEEENQLPFT